MGNPAWRVSINVRIVEALISPVRTYLNPFHPAFPIFFCFFVFVCLFFWLSGKFGSFKNCESFPTSYSIQECPLEGLWQWSPQIHWNASPDRAPCAKKQPLPLLQPILSLLPSNVSTVGSRMRPEDCVPVPDLVCLRTLCAYASCLPGVPHQRL